MGGGGGHIAKHKTKRNNKIKNEIELDTKGRLWLATGIAHQFRVGQDRTILKTVTSPCIVRCLLRVEG